jgi:adenine-specific DNA methylase
MEIAKGRMRITEARKALRELIDTAQEQKALAHYRDLARMSDEEMQDEAKKALAPTKSR